MSAEKVPSVSMKPKQFASVIRKHKKSKNIVHMMRRTEINGRGPKSIEQLPENFFQSEQSSSSPSSSQDYNLPANVLYLKQYTLMQKIDLTDQSLKDTLDGILDHFTTEFVADSTAKSFNYLGGIEVLADILVQAFLDDCEDIDHGCEVTAITNNKEHETVETIMQIMHNCTRTSAIDISHLCDRPLLLHLLFSFLADLKTYVDATLLLEEMIMSGPSKGVINLREIKCLPYLLEKPLTHQQQAHLFHIVTSVITAIDFIPTMNCSLEQNDRWLKTSDSVQVNKSNQEFLVNLEPFIDQLFAVACWKVRFDSDNVVVRNIIESLMTDFSRNFVQQITEQDLRQIYHRLLANPEDSSMLEFSIFHEKPIRADAFLLLSMLLTGCCREKMQQLVIEKDLIRRMEDSLETVVWKEFNEDFRQNERNQSHEEHTCEPDSAVKIQFLRFLHSVSDHHLHRYLLLGQDDLEEMEMLAGAYDIPLHPDFEKFDHSKCCRKRGYLTQVVDKLKLEPQDSYIRFWMTRALESFLRGPTCLIDQLFLIKRNLVEDLLSLLISHDSVSSEVIQGNFDLLSSLMKENIHAFQRFNKVIDCTDKFKTLTRRIEQNIVDSNMFVRCVIITLHYMNSVEPNQSEFIPKCRILKYYSMYENRIEVIISLIETLVPSTLSQENVSCLNTSIIIFLIAKANNKLEKYLSFIANYDIQFSRHGQTVLTNLRRLLCFWMKHYSLSFKASDCKSLQEGSGFSFIEWRILVSQLIDGDMTSQCSIMHYISSCSA